jgi:hypothetical protein
MSITKRSTILKIPLLREKKGSENHAMGLNHI